MPATFEEIEARALQLTPHERSELAHRLLVSLDSEPQDSPAAIAQAWDEAIARRVADMEAGRTAWIPVEEVMADVRATIAAAKTPLVKMSLSREVQANLQAATGWYLDAQAFAAAEEFANGPGRAWVRIADFPALGKPGNLGMRLMTLNKFPYSLVYRIELDRVRVIAVAHHSRRPGHWVGRQ
jgi:putative addiction module component (TIGR02574 family)